MVAGACQMECPDCGHREWISYDVTGQENQICPDCRIELKIDFQISR